eukprot:gene7210-11526_t
MNLLNKRRIKTIYLSIYNLIQSIGWLYLFFRTLRKNIKKKEQTTWDRTNLILKSFQTLGILDILNSYFKIIKSSPKVTCQQILARLFITYFVVDKVPKLKSSRTLYPLLLSWSLSDTIRYFYFSLKEIGFQPYWIKYLRYSTFLVLYPVGMLSEALLILETFKLQIPSPSTKVTDNIKTREDITTMSKTHNIILFLFLITSIPLFYPSMFKHMMNQRKKYLE